MTFVAGWRLALRLAWREAWRAKARSALVVVMVTFPVVAVVAADVAQATASVSSAEGLARRIGAAQAGLSAIPDAGQVFQAADPDRANGWSGGRRPAASLSDVERVLGARPAIELRTLEGSPVRTSLGVLQVGATGVDMASPLAKGLFRLTSGRFPRTTNEVAVNAALADHGFAVGDRLQVANGRSATVVGIAESAAERTAPRLLALPGFFPAADHGLRSWLVGGAPVTWDQVRELNQLGVLVLSREVIEHPPSSGQLAPQLRTSYSSDRTTLYTVLALIGVMALIEVVLLAGPAFAVGARRQSRSLALIAANGGTPTQSRRVILGSAMVIGAFAAAVGIVLGIALGRALVPLLQSTADTYFGPFQIRWTHVLGVAAFGLVSAFLAALVPAWIASRQDVVAVLAGRRGDRAASRRSPLVGLLLVACGVGAAVLGARREAGATLIAGAALLTVLGMIFLVPVVVVVVARLGRRFPLPLRYAVRDAARHRTRTVPAVAAVAATVAGVVALSIGNTSDQAQARAAYQPMLAPGVSTIAMNGGGTDWDAVEQAVARIAPGARASRVLGIAGGRPLMVDAGRGPGPGGNFMSSLPVQALVSDGGSLPGLLRGQVSEQDWEAASPVFSRGGAVVLGRAGGTADRVRFSLGRQGPSVVVPAAEVATSSPPRVLAVVSPEVARALHVEVGTVGLVLTGTPLTVAQDDDLQQVLQGMDDGAYLYTERGYQVPSSERVLLWILFGLAAVLMLGGTLTATFLALSDARPDLATLSAVGASPRMRRAVAAAYAVSVGMVGAVLGAAVGFVPGIAITYPLTRNLNQPGPSHYLDIPWLQIAALVVALPVLTAAIVGLLARSRLPLVARLD
ncbi:MAG TPA: FtsX-like permease family protein [Nocardioides sp.]|uniref:FtsX-like permease family protein n=1 Tax=Nocardioides sp. TaxID=35761 RepID=UPI002F41A38C